MVVDKSVFVKDDSMESEVTKLAVVEDNTGWSERRRDAW